MLVAPNLWQVQIPFDEAICPRFPHFCCESANRPLLVIPLRENAMKNIFLITNLAAGLVLVCGTAQAQSPKLVCHNYTNAWGTPAAVTATTGTVSDEAAGYFVAAITDENGYLEVKAFQNDCKEVGHVHSDTPVPIGAPITAVAAADLNSSQIVTAVVDQNGTLQLRTWAVGGKAGIAALNAGYLSSMNTASPLGTTPFLGITALSATEVVTAYQDPVGNFILQQWNIPSGGVPAPVGKPLNLGGAISKLCTAPDGGLEQVAFGGPSKIAISTVDPSLGMFVTAASDENQNLYVDVWSLGNNGTFEADGQACVPNIVNGANPGLAIAGGFGQVIEKAGKYHFAATQHYAVTPLVNGEENFEVLYWDISSTGALSKTANLTEPGVPSAPATTGTAAAMLPTGVPISANLQQSGDSLDVNVGWYGYTGMSTHNEIEITTTPFNGAGVYGVSAAEAGASFPPPLLEVLSGTAYFVTGTMTALGNLPPMVEGSSPANEGKFQLNLWSYPVVFFR
jgi:hypothetical protein